MRHLEGCAGMFQGTPEMQCRQCRLWEHGAHDIMLRHGAIGLMMYDPGDIEAIWHAHVLGASGDCWD